jgi:hypothetical protein
METFPRHFQGLLPFRARRRTISINSRWRALGAHRLESRPEVQPMQRSSRLSTLFTAVVIVSALMACKKFKGSSSDEGTSSSSSSASSADSTGIPECDEYLTKYQQCVDDKVPAAAQPGMTEGIKKMRETYKQAGANPVTKTAMAEGCKKAMETTKTALTQYGCTW